MLQIIVIRSLPLEGFLSGVCSVWKACCGRWPAGACWLSLPSACGSRGLCLIRSAFGWGCLWELNKNRLKNKDSLLFIFTTLVNPELVKYLKKKKKKQLCNIWKTTYLVDNLNLFSHIKQKLKAKLGFPDSSVGKESICNAGDSSVYKESTCNAGDLVWFLGQEDLLKG